MNLDSTPQLGKISAKFINFPKKEQCEPIDVDFKNDLDSLITGIVTIKDLVNSRLSDVIKSSGKMELSSSDTQTVADEESDTEQDYLEKLVSDAEK